jgi:hypothetical protein
MTDSNQKQLETDEAEDDPEDEVRIPGASKPQGFFKPMEYLHSVRCLFLAAVFCSLTKALGVAVLYGFFEAQ